MSGDRVKTGDVMLLVGTRKGGFILSSDSDRYEWYLSGPFDDDSDLFHLVYDPREGGALLSAANNNFWGPQVRISRDLGSTWEDAAQSPRMKYGSRRSVDRLWHIKPGRNSEPGVLYLGAQPAIVVQERRLGTDVASVVKPDGSSDPRPVGARTGRAVPAQHRARPSL